MVNCCVPGCTNYSAKTTNVSFHKIPPDKQRRKAWLERIRRLNMPLLQYSYVCSDHFSASCFQSNLQAKITGQRYKRRLKEDAVPSIFDYASQSTKKRPRLSSENRRDRRMQQEDVAELLAAANDQNASTEGVVSNEEVVISENSEFFSWSPTKCDVGIQCCLQPLTHKSKAIQTEFEDVAMTTRARTKSPPPTQANATEKVFLPTDETTTGIFPLSKTSLINAEGWKVNNDHNYAMHAPPYELFPTYEDDSFSVTSQPPLPEVEVVIPNTVTEGNETDKSEDDNDYEDDYFKDPNWHLPPNVNSFTREDVKDDTLFEEESKRDYITPDSEKKSVVFESSIHKLLKRCPSCGDIIIDCERKTTGSMLSVQLTCNSGHTVKWDSQTVVKGNP
ncbi:THAP domain-containing protein 5-like [Stylophora pistillata]|uniref:THAP domain-containing protein 5-like n=1 Tax=Stylophora pistillata TaxID=50429 RepID=UPI000C04D12E|nr:THAP domain-containing protein 5-like [Stylophora pistillata]